MLQAAVIIVGLAAFGAWIMTVLAALRMLRHRTPGVSGWWYATNGIAFFTGKNFSREAEPARRQMLRYAAFFFLALIAAMVLSIIAIPKA